MCFLIVITTSVMAARMPRGPQSIVTRWSMTMCNDVSLAQDMYNPAGSGVWGSVTLQTLKNMDFSGSAEYLCQSVDTTLNTKPYRPALWLNGVQQVTTSTPQFYSIAPWGYKEFCWADFAPVLFDDGDSVIVKFDALLSGSPTVESTCVTVGGFVNE